MTIGALPPPVLCVPPLAPPVDPAAPLAPAALAPPADDAVSCVDPPAVAASALAPPSADPLAAPLPPDEIFAVTAFWARISSSERRLPQAAQSAARTQHTTTRHALCVLIVLPPSLMPEPYFGVEACRSSV